jgi:hypothetical protein
LPFRPSCFGWRPARRDPGLSMAAPNESTEKLEKIGTVYFTL